MEGLEAAMRPLRSLQVLVISQCNVLLPDAVRRMPKLERLVSPRPGMAARPAGQQREAEREAGSG